MRWEKRDVHRDRSPLSGLLAFVFGAGAVGKLTRMRSEVDKSTKLRISWPRYRLIALPEAAAAVGSAECRAGGDDVAGRDATVLQRAGRRVRVGDA